ncbi:MAG: DUF4340 domain-containing protein [Candidatus Hydrogenedentes bacterium]|nr:DUF4340 domain-containing protein [Candidatus Hydrogenedentota bacterium]
MKFRNTVQLGALLALLILAYFGWQYFQAQSEQLAQEAKRVFSFEGADIERLSIDQVDAEPTAGARDESGSWTIREPNPTIKPNAELWDRVAEQTARLMNERTLPEGALGLEAYGLELPRLVVGLESGGARHTLRFGFLEPTQTLRYAQLDDGPVFLVKKEAVFELDRPLELLRQSWLVDRHEAPVLRLEFARIMTEAEYERQLEVVTDPPPVGTESDVVIIVERSSAEAPWMQISPVSTAANQEKVDELVKEIQYARGRHFVDAPESYADYGLEPATARITIENGAEGGGRQTFYFGDMGAVGGEGGASGVWVRKEGEPAVFLMDGHITRLYPRINALRERRLIARRIGAFRKLEYIGRDSSFTLERLASEGDAWSMVDPPLDDTDELYVTHYIAALKSVEGVQFYPEGPEVYGLDDPEAIIRFSGAEGEEPLEIRLTPDPGDPDRYYALTDAGEVAGVPKEHVAFAIASPQHFRDLSLLRFSLDRAQKMVFQFDGVEYTLEKAYNRWVVTAPEDRFMPNQQDAMTLLLAVAGLRAVAVEESTEADSPEYGFDAPRFTIQVTLAPEHDGGDPVVLGPLEIGAVTPGIDDERFARTASRPGVYRVKQSLIEQVGSAVAGIRTRSGGGRTGN